MLLQPRNFKWNSNQNNRTTSSTNVSNLHYGCSGVSILQPYRTSANRIFRFNIFLNNASRNSDFTRRSLWINLFPHLPLTNNPNGMSMGKGAGNLSTWYTYVSGGVFLVEFYNLRPGRASYFAMSIKHNLPVVSSHVEHYSNSINVYGGQNTNPKFWAIF